MKESQPLVRLFLKGFILFLSITALFAIVAVLGWELDDLQIKLLLTSLSVSAGCVCGMACAAALSRPNLRPAGLAGIGATALAVVAVDIGMWIELDLDPYWKVAVTLVIASIAIAHSLLLQLPRLLPPYRWVQLTSTTLIALLSLLILVAIWIEIDADLYFRVVTAVSILVVLFTAVIPILMRMSKDALRSGEIGEEWKPLEVLSRRQGSERIIRLEGKDYRLVELNKEQPE